MSEPYHVILAPMRALQPKVIVIFARKEIYVQGGDVIAQSHVPLDLFAIRLDFHLRLSYVQKDFFAKKEQKLKMRMVSAEVPRLVQLVFSA